MIWLKLYLLCGTVMLLLCYLQDRLLDSQSSGWLFWRHVRMMALILGVWPLCLWWFIQGALRADEEMAP
jgi:hypothetical protein